GTWWQDGPMTRAVREGGICYLDEVVEARQDTAVVLHPLADDRRELFIERTGETLKAPPGFMLVVSYNPGYQNLLKGMKPSTRQRFVAMRFDYPSAAEEQRIVANEARVDAELAGQIVKLGQALRRLEQHDLEEVASTRLLIFAARMIGAGMSPREACMSCLAEPLSDDPQTVAALMDVVDVHFACGFCQVRPALAGRPGHVVLHPGRAVGLCDLHPRVCRHPVAQPRAVRAEPRRTRQFDGAGVDAEPADVGAVCR